MGMTIDEAIEYNEYLKTYMEINGKKGTHKFLEENHIALNMAISTMRKYQKIEEIVSLNDEEFKQCGLKELKEILEVIADGNKNNHHASNC